MKLEYYYLVFEEDVDRCPKELWEAILRRLCVVFSVYGFSKSITEIHELHVICEDNKRLSLYDRLSPNIKRRLRQRRKDIKDLKGFIRFLKPVLLREDDLHVKDNTKAIMDDDRDD